jgi:hypothetical protein
MNIFLFAICCFLALSAVVIGILGLATNTKCSGCVNQPSIWCYDDWRCPSGPQPKQILDDILGTDSTPGFCARDPTIGTSCSCPDTSNWSEAPSTGPNGNYGSGGSSYDPSISNSVDVCRTFQ